MASFYWVIQPAAAPNPSAAQVVAGQDGNGSAAVASGSVVDTGQVSPIDASASASGLTPGTSYEVAWVWFDGAADYSSVVVGTFDTHPGLVVGDVSHAHTSDAVTLSSESTLTIDDVLHGHTSTSVVLALPSVAYLLTEPFKDWGGTLLPLATIPSVVVLDPATRAVLLSLADQVTQADARLRLEDSALPTGQPVVVVSFNADGSARGVDTYTVQ